MGYDGEKKYDKYNSFELAYFQQIMKCNSKAMFKSIRPLSNNLW